MQSSHDIARLIEIMAALRQPKTGCPWDIEQTFDTIVPYTIEETYEVVDAIERRDALDLREELGDLLLQVVYHSQLAAELGLFEFGDVVEGITRKMIRRHPHVFGDAEARSARSAKGQWNRIKEEEKRERREERAARRSLEANGSEWLHVPAGDSDGLLDAVPNALPALPLARKIQERAATVGFDWTEPEPIIAKLREETAEFEEAAASSDRSAIESELGDILFTVVNLARRYEIDPDTALRGTVAKFRRWFSHMEDAARQGERSLADLSLPEQETLWQGAKASARTD
ncbi:nucleoside triphosphate pyrophosphohydrolase [Aureimonas sp. ME7]|uniref:nucleoside triphosphate pyrophosphohydrolase n=1 Tax=Aureimonas sp. ME7 TaxID=2744252 RepID=UPI0015F64CC0|nr:nucleoside triphosphate pyrophosphohydrolase [Aureimonas sp. ME7]